MKKCIRSPEKFLDLKEKISTETDKKSESLLRDVCDGNNRHPSADRVCVCIQQQFYWQNFHLVQGA